MDRANEAKQTDQPDQSDETGRISQGNRARQAEKADETNQADQPDETNQIRQANQPNLANGRNRAKRAHRQRQRSQTNQTNLAAFTLVELLVVLAVAGILLATALPDLRGTIERHEIRAAGTDLMAALHLARSQAIGRGEMVTVAPTDGASWQQGWTVFADRDGNGVRDAGEPVLFSRGPVPERLRIWSRLTAAAPPWYVAYNSAGRSCRAGNHLAGNWGTLSLQLGSQQRNIKINMLGRARLCDPAMESGCTAANQQ